MATTLLIAVGTGVAATFAGLSMALGAFIAGLVLAETEYRRAIESIDRTVQGPASRHLLPARRPRHRPRTAEFEPGGDHRPVDLVDRPQGGADIRLVTRLRHQSRAIARGCLLLGSGGEFAFIVLGAALALNIVTPAMHSEAFLVVSITMALIPVMARLGQMLRGRNAGTNR